MSKKTKIILITFVLTLIVAILVYLWVNRNNTVDQNGETPWYQTFNPFGTSSEKQGDDSLSEVAINEEGEVTTISENSKFLKITDYAISGATFVEEDRLKDPNIATEIKQITKVISPDTLENRKEIQQILNKELSLKPALTVDGVFGKKVTQAIKDFQKLKNLKITGIIDEYTAPYFSKTVEMSNDDKYEKAPTVRFVERKNGYIYKMFLDKKTRERVSNSTIPVVYEAFFDKTGNTVIYRNLSSNEVVTSFMGTIGQAMGEFLPENIIDLSVSKDGSKFFYLIKNQDGVIGTVRNFIDSKRDIVFNHPFTEWLSQWDSNGNLYLTTKASYDVSGSVFSLNTANKTLTKLFGNVNGLTTLVSPNGESILYSYSTNNGPKLGIFNKKNRSNNDIGLYGLAEKCVWSSDNINIYCAIPTVIPDSRQPDLWYQGISSFVDSFVKINTQNMNEFKVADSSKEIPVDASNLFLDKDENSLFFTNKKDSSFWSLNLR